MYRRNKYEDYGSSDLPENTDLNVNASIKVQAKCQLSHVSQFFAVLSCLTYHFERSFLDHWLESKVEGKEGNFQPVAVTSFNSSWD